MHNNNTNSYMATKLKTYLNYIAKCRLSPIIKQIQCMMDSPVYSHHVTVFVVVGFADFF